MPKLRTIKRLFAMSWSYTLQYRGDFLLWTIAITITPLVSLAIWYAVTASRSGDLSSQEILTYYILVMLIQIATASWRGFELIQEILNGDIVRYLIRPISNFWEYGAGVAVTKVLQLSPPVVIFLGLLIARPHLFSPALFEWRHIALFIPSLLLAAVLSFVIDMAIATMAFWLEDAQELQSYRFLLMQIASGVMIPFALMPQALRAAFSALPFRYIISAPAEIMLGQVEGSTAVALLAYQALWVCIITGLLATLWRQGLKTYAVPGQ